MGKLKKVAKPKKCKQKSKNDKSKQIKLTIEELLEKAEEHLDRCELESAFQYVKRALDLDSKHVEALSLMASVQMEMGNAQSAKDIYEQLIKLNPNEGFSNYMCLAQLSDGAEAVELYKKGVELMLVEYVKQQQQQTQTEKSADSNGSSSSASSRPKASSSIEDDNDDDNEDDDDEDEPGKVTREDISTAFGSIAELYLTDLCMEENAESLCKSYLDKSLEYDAHNPETLQLLASFWLSKENLTEAKEAILRSLDCWLPKYIELSESGPLVDPSQGIKLTYDSRISTSRILTEVTEFDKAITVLEQLVEEDDEVVVVWYMLGWVSYCQGEDYFSNAKFYLKKANQLARKIKYEQKYLDDELRGHIDELLEKLTEVKTDDEAEDEADGGGEDNDDDDDYSTDEELEEQSVTAKDANNNNNNNANSKSREKRNLDEQMELT